jgi:hypothetical protein
MFSPSTPVNVLGNVFALCFKVFYCQIPTLFTHVNKAEKDSV